MMMVEKGATSQLIESLVPYGLTCCNPTKVATMEKLGMKHTCEEIKEHIKTGGILAVICAFAVYSFFMLYLSIQYYFVAIKVKVLAHPAQNT